MNKFFNLMLLSAMTVYCQAATYNYRTPGGDILKITPLSETSVRVQIGNHMPVALEELIYSDNLPDINFNIQKSGRGFVLSTNGMSVSYDRNADALSFFDADGNLVLAESPHGRAMSPSTAQEVPAVAASQSFVSPSDEHLYGTGQFQDGYLDVRGLSRCLTQVNTQISVPFVLSNKGYGLLWNNYGHTDFNPVRQTVALQPLAEGESVEVDVTSTVGNKKERREMYLYSGNIRIDEDGDYALLLDVGQTMARKHKIVVDGKVLTDINNLWLPPTTSVITHLSEGSHNVEVEGVKGDAPVIGWRKVDNVTEWSSPVANGIDYTVFVGQPDDVIADFRSVSGNVPMLPKYALGYVHCRERYDNQQELLDNVAEFRRRNIPIDVIVQDWQWWGKHGWNAMQFDEEKYPAPKAMLDSLHDMDMRLMISVWAKFDHNCELGKISDERGYYIPGTDWVDFFNPKAADFYWNSQSQRVLKPYGIDAWWQDATEPENDDLVGRRIAAGTLPGEVYANVYPLMVNRRVYAGLRADDPDRRTMIMTRSAFPGIQRYGVFTWSGDVGHDWGTLERQIAGGLGQMAAGLPWWTFDAGGFFRPGDQYTNKEYQEMMLRWVQTATFLPMMRVHGYVSQTEPWRYGEDTLEKFIDAINLRYAFLPYNYSLASQVSRAGYTMMRPLVMDFATDEEALRQKCQYMWGPSVLVAPVTAPGVESWRVYLPQGCSWFDYWTGESYAGGQYVDVPVTLDRIPLFVRAGSILPLSQPRQHVGDNDDAPIEVKVYPGADASFVLYEDAGDGYGYENGEFTEIPMTWNDASRTLTIAACKGSYPGMPDSRAFEVSTLDGTPRTITYTGKATKIKL